MAPFTHLIPLPRVLNRPNYFSFAKNWYYNYTSPVTTLTRLLFLLADVMRFSDFSTLLVPHTENCINTTNLQPHRTAWVVNVVKKTLLVLPYAIYKSAYSSHYYPRSRQCYCATRAEIYFSAQANLPTSPYNTWSSSQNTKIKPKYLQFRCNVQNERAHLWASRRGSQFFFIIGSLSWQKSQAETSPIKIPSTTPHIFTQIINHTVDEDIFPTGGDEGDGYDEVGGDPFASERASSDTHDANTLDDGLDQSNRHGLLEVWIWAIQ